MSAALCLFVGCVWYCYTFLTSSFEIEKLVQGRRWQQRLCGEAANWNCSSPDLLKERYVRTYHDVLFMAFATCCGYHVPLVSYGLFLSYTPQFV